MKLSRSLLSAIVTVLTVSMLVFGCDAYVKAHGKDWAFEAGASTVAKLKKK